jgi:hypothetical protein
MADETEAAETADAGDDGQVKGPRRAPDFGNRAARTLRQARGALDQEALEPNQLAEFLLGEARVLALLDLARAIREGREDSGA